MASSSSSSSSSSLFSSPLVHELPSPHCKSYNGSLPFPCILQPQTPGMTWTQLQAWIHTNRTAVLDLINKRGALLFRGFDVESAEEMTSIADSIGFAHKPYVGGAAVRTPIVGNRVFTTNESPPKEPIPFHHEMSQVPVPPTHIIFYCVTPSAQGGATPLIDSSVVYDYFAQTHPNFAEKVEKLGLKYVRVLPFDDDPTSAIGRGWKSTYLSAEQQKNGIDDMKKIAEAKMKDMGMEWQWLENGDLHTTTAALPGVRVCPYTNKKVFFNSMIAAFLGWIDSRNDPKKAVLLGDGSAVDASVMNDVALFMERERVVLPWVKGDVMVINNSLVMHSREPFIPPRKILASVIEAIKPTTGLGTVCVSDVSGVSGVSDDGVVVVPKAVLSSGDSIPMVGFGLWKVSKDTAAGVVVDAVKAGYRMFDGACDYGNEKEVGVGLKEVFEKGIVKREDLFITSKLWNTYHAKEHVRAACLRTLQDLGLAYLDLYLVHFPIALKYVPFETRYPPEWIHDPTSPSPKMEIESRVTIRETWEAMEELVKEGLVRNIGVANMNCVMLRDVLAYAKVKPMVNQVEMHPYLTQHKLLRFCRMNGIHVTAYSSFGGSSYIELGGASQNDCVINDPVIQKIAERHQKTSAQIALAWAVQRGTSVIPKTANQKRLLENITVCDVTLSPSEIKEIDALNRNRRFNDPGVYCELAFNCFCPIFE